MYLHSLFPDDRRREKNHVWRACLACDDSNAYETEFFKYISSLSQAEYANLMTVIENACVLGPTNIPSKNRHEIDSNNKIFEFIKGDHRVPWFYDDGKLIICTGAFLKQGQKTPKSEKDKAKSIKDNYFSKKINGQVRLK